MSQNWTGENVKLWINPHERQDGTTWFTYAISVGRKDITGSYVYKSVKAVMGKDIRLDRYSNGDFVDFSGFPTIDMYTDRSGNERQEIAVFITSMNPHGAEVDSFEEADDDIPF